MERWSDGVTGKSSRTVSAGRQHCPAAGPSARVLRAARSLYPRVVRVRRHIHANPELSNQEYGTARTVHSYLRRLGLRPRYHAGRRGVTAAIENGNGPVVVLRADTDALPIEEKNRIPYRSRQRGVMHACGHDLHTASLLGAAEILLRLKPMWRGKAVVLFQPAEEAEPGGAVRMIEEGAFPRDAAAVFGLHVNPEHSAGQVGLRAGSDYAGIRVFDVIVRGRGGHGATPERTIDPIACASSMVLALRAISEAGRRRAVPAVVTVGSFHGGTKRNVVPDVARFEGTLRTFSRAEERRMITTIRAKMNTLARSAGAKADVIFGDSYPPGRNDPALTARARRAFGSLLGRKNVVDRSRPVLYAEDFAYYQWLVPGVYAPLGVRAPGQKNAAGVHSSRFLPDERAILTAMALHAAFVLELCGRPFPRRGIQ
jgi:amidohydrolase